MLSPTTTLARAQSHAQSQMIGINVLLNAPVTHGNLADLAMHGQVLNVIPEVHLVAASSPPAGAGTSAFAKPESRPVAGMMIAEVPPSAPTHPRASIVLTFVYNIVLTWRDTSNNEDGFVIEWWNDDPASGWVLVETTTVGSNETSASFRYPGLDGRRNRLRVKAFNSSGDSAWSHWANLNFH